MLKIKFEKGYFINNSGQKTEVLIKNLDWKNNPTEFEYKTEDSSEIKKQNIKDIQEFGINNSEKYTRKTVMIDRSLDELDKMSETRKPEFTEETLFLKYVVEGKASLYYYEDGNLRRLFYSSGSSDGVKQLIYKPYYLNESQITYNQDYKKQLAEILNCGIEQKQIEYAAYRTPDIAKMFIKYNECSGENPIKYGQTATKRDLFNLNIRPGINLSSLQTTVYSYSGDEKTDYDSKVSFRIGIEGEFILPFNKNKWALFIEPTYQYYKAETQVVVYPGTVLEGTSKRRIDYKSIDIPFGVRYYLFLNKQSKIFINAGYAVNLDLNSALKGEYSEIKLESGNNFIFGAGYKYNDKFSAEFRVQSPRNVFRNYFIWDSNYRAVSFILGYTLF